MKLFGLRKMTREEAESFLHSIFSVKNGYNSYYNVVGIGYRIAEFVFLFLFLGFLAISVLGNLSGITYTNAEYLFRNFGMTLEQNRTEATELVYNPDTEMSFATVGKGLAVCGNTGVSVFSATGRQTCTEVMALHHPCIRTSEKYTLIFESGGREYYLFGPYSLLFAGTTEYPIRGASIADNGTYALISGAEGYTSAVTVFDSDFDPVNRYLKHAYIISAELNNTGDRLILTTLETDENGAYLTTVTSCTVGEKEETVVTTYPDTFPLLSKPSGDLILTVDNKGLCQWKNGAENRISFLNGTVEEICDDDGAVSVLLSTVNSGERLYMLMSVASDGTYSAGPSFSADFCHIAIRENRTFLLTEKGLSVFENGKLSDAQPINKPYSADSALLVYSKEKVYLAGKSAAYLIGVEK